MADYEYGTPEWNGQNWLYQLRRGHELVTRIKAADGRRRHLGRKTIEDMAKSSKNNDVSIDAGKTLTVMSKLRDLIGTHVELLVAEPDTTAVDDAYTSGILRGYNLNTASLGIATSTGLQKVHYPTIPVPYNPFESDIEGQSSLFAATSPVVMRAEQLYPI